MLRLCRGRLSARAPGEALSPATRIYPRSNGQSCGSPDGCPNRLNTVRPYRPDRLHRLAWHHQRCAECSGPLRGSGRSKPWPLIAAGTLPMFPLEHPHHYKLPINRGPGVQSQLRRSPTSLVSARNVFTPRADALARNIVLSVYLTTDGRNLAVCSMSDLPEATATALLHAIRSRWLELKDNRGVCLTAEGRRLALRQAN